jgi:adenine-specific DNA-methyltransferase
MNTVFIGGSRRVSRLPIAAKERLENVIKGRHRVVVGDANGADKAVQSYLHDAGYDLVTVFCSGNQPRNNVGRWPVEGIMVAQEKKGFQLYAEKDRAMAGLADFGLMIWDGRSPGTALNVLRLLRAKRIAVLINVASHFTLNFRTMDDWSAFLRQSTRELREALQERATPEEWGGLQTTANLFESASQMETSREITETVPTASSVGML